MPEVPLIVRGGMSVLPREVEQVLLGHPAVAEAVVIGVPDRFWGEVVGAAVRLSAPLPAAAADLSRYCRAFLARYKVPERWLFTEELPRTQNGKVRRAVVTAQLAVLPGPGLPAVDPIDIFRPRLATEDLRIPRQVRRSWALEDL
jgi:acyl-CoA synthetase (AMP-forming)/AMP-acid ligase II